MGIWWEVSAIDNCLKQASASLIDLPQPDLSRVTEQFFVKNTVFGFGNQIH